MKWLLLSYILKVLAYFQRVKQATAIERAKLDKTMLVNEIGETLFVIDPAFKLNIKIVLLTIKKLYIFNSVTNGTMFEKIKLKWI